MIQWGSKLNNWLNGDMKYGPIIKCHLINEQPIASQKFRLPNLDLSAVHMSPIQIPTVFLNQNICQKVHIWARKSSCGNFAFKFRKITKIFKENSFSPFRSFWPIFRTPMQSFWIDGYNSLGHLLRMLVYQIFAQCQDVLTLVVVDEVQVLEQTVLNSYVSMDIGSSPLLFCLPLDLIEWLNRFKNSFSVLYTQKT